MAQVTVTKVVEGSAHVVIRVNILNDDGGGELNNYVFFSPSDLLPARLNNAPCFRLMQTWYSMVWFDVTLKTGTLQPSTIWTMARDCDSHTDFRSFGGLLDPFVYMRPPADDNGVLTLSTNGFNVLGAQGTFVFELRKTND